MVEHQDILEAAKGLVTLYGYLPSFHDAHITAIEFGQKSLRLGLYVYDLPSAGLWKQDWDSDLHCNVTFIWPDLNAFELKVTDHWLNEISFEHAGAEFVTILVDQETGAQSRITSRAIPEISAVPATSRFVSASGDPIKYLRLVAKKDGL